jgi:hypothetical protein
MRRAQVDAAKFLNAGNCRYWPNGLQLACGRQEWNRNMQNKLIQNIFLLGFLLTLIVTLLGLALPDYVKIPDFYLKGLFTALVIELIGIVIAAGKVAFRSGDAEHYIWQIFYPDNLRQGFESLYVTDENFKKFYEQNKTVLQSKIHDDAIPSNVLNKFLDNLFVIKKS